MARFFLQIRPMGLVDGNLFVVFHTYQESLAASFLEKNGWCWTTYGRDGGGDVVIWKHDFSLDIQTPAEKVVGPQKCT